MPDWSHFHEGQPGIPHYLQINDGNPFGVCQPQVEQWDTFVVRVHQTDFNLAPWRTGSESLQDYDEFDTLRYTPTGFLCPASEYISVPYENFPPLHVKFTNLSAKPLRINRFYATKAASDPNEEIRCEGEPLPEARNVNCPDLNPGCFHQFGERNVLSAKVAGITHDILTFQRPVATGNTSPCSGQVWSWYDRRPDDPFDITTGIQSQPYIGRDSITRDPWFDTVQWYTAVDDGNVFQEVLGIDFTRLQEGAKHHGTYNVSYADNVIRWMLNWSINRDPVTPDSTATMDVELTFYMPEVFNWFITESETSDDTQKHYYGPQSSQLDCHPEYQGREITQTKNPGLAFWYVDSNNSFTNFYSWSREVDLCDF